MSSSTMPDELERVFAPDLRIAIRHANEINSLDNRPQTPSFRSLLLGIAFFGRQSDLDSSSTPRWFADYVRSKKIDFDGSQTTRRSTVETLEEIDFKSHATHDLHFDPTDVAGRVFTAAANLLTSPARLEVRHVLAAYIYRCPEERQQDLRDWGFDRIDWSNAFLAHIESVPEFRAGELEQWLRLHQETFGTVPNSPSVASSGEPSVPNAPAFSDNARFHFDSPSEADHLGRQGFVDAMAIRLNRAWQEYHGTAAQTSFTLHLHGPWGSGKTSLLKMLRKQLQAGGRSGEDLRWIVVDFNAWQHQRLVPPWWALLDSIYRQSVRQIHSNFGELVHSWMVRIRERWWRISTGRKDYLLAMIGSFALLAILLYFLKRGVLEAEVVGAWSNLGKFLTSAGAIISAVVGIWSTVLLASRSMITGSSRAAQSFVDTAGDPMERICTHFRRLAKWINKPIIVFIDDLDRCQSKYVVELLEGVQTLFSEPRVVYVIAADKRWLHVCFEDSYKLFSTAVNEPGRRLGALFLEKAFELSLSMPRLSPEARRIYWDFLISNDQSNLEQRMNEAEARARSEFAGADTEEQVLVRLRERSDDPVHDQVRKGLAIRRLADQKVVESTELFLRPFAPLIEPNPRAMKRLVNAYAIWRDMAVLAGVDVLGDRSRRKQLALWSILSLRWPRLEEFFEEFPHQIEPVRDGRGTVSIESALAKLTTNADVLDVLNGRAPGIDTKLDAMSVCAFTGISVSQQTADGEIGSSNGAAEIVGV